MVEFESLAFDLESFFDKKFEVQIVYKEFELDLDKPPLLGDTSLGNLALLVEFVDSLK